MKWRINQKTIKEAGHEGLPFLFPKLSNNCVQLQENKYQSDWEVTQAQKGFLVAILLPIKLPVSHNTVADSLTPHKPKQYWKSLE